MRSVRVLSALLVAALLAIAPIWAAKPDPSVGLEIQNPVDQAKCMPGERIEVTVQVVDPLQLVRHVFVRVAAPNNRLISSDQEASSPAGGRPTPGQPELWKKTVDLPVSAVSGKYIMQVEALGDGNTRLQWKTLTFEVTAAAFGLRIVSPVEGTVLSRNDNLDVTVQLEDPRRKARRVFVMLEDPQKKQILNGDREADRKGNLWIRNIHIPATAVPGMYQLAVIVYGEGHDVLSKLTRPVAISVAPVRMGDVVLDPPSGIKPGQTFRLSASLTDPRNIVRYVWVTVEGPTGKSIVKNAVARRSGEAYTLEVNLEEDTPLGTYTVEFQAVAQAGEVVASRRLSFPIRNR